MKYAVIGAGGQLGREFAKCLPADLFTALTHDRIDVGSASSVDTCACGLECDVLVNLAAFHNVNECEHDPAAAFQINAAGAGYVARAAHRKRRKVVYFSTDYVFGLDANRDSPYLESDSTGCLNVYGASKIAGEHLVRAATDDHLIVRSSSIFGAMTSHKGWTFPEMILQRATKGEQLRVVTDQYMSPTYAPDLARTVIDLLEAGACGTVHVTNSGGCSWYEFASAALEVAGIEYCIEPVTSDAFPSVARRPRYSRLDSEKLNAMSVAPMRHWRDALRIYLREKGFIT